MFKKLMVVWMTLALLVGLALPASASIDPITGNIRIRINGYNLNNPNVLDFEGRLYLTLKGTVNDFTTWKSGIYMGYSDFSAWKDLVTYPALKIDYAVVTVAPPKLPIKVEMGALSVSTYGVTAIYSDAYELGGVSGFNIISDTLVPGLTTWLTLSPDVAADSGNQEGAALGFNFAIPGDKGSVSGGVWTRKDKDTPGYRICGKWNVSPGNVALYATYGKRAGDTEAKYQVIGVNIPAASQIGLNPYVEYDLYNNAIGFYTSVTLSTNTSLLLYLCQDTSTKDWKFTPYISFSF